MFFFLFFLSIFLDFILSPTALLLFSVCCVTHFIALQFYSAILQQLLKHCAFMSATPLSTNPVFFFVFVLPLAHVAIPLFFLDGHLIEHQALSNP